MSFTKLDYCQYLLSSQVNYTLTNLADHLESFSHDTINRYLKGEKLTPRLLFEQVEPMLERDPQAYLIFDDTVLEKSFGPSIEVARKQWSGNDKSVIRGIGVVSCVYVNPTTERFWVIDYRIFDPDRDGKTKLDHVREMLGSVEHRGVLFERVLMDTWYATKDLMLLIEGMGKTYYCPLKSNRQVDDSGGERLTGGWMDSTGAKRNCRRASS
jgi:DDE superfamily endonuclease